VSLSLERVRGPLAAVPLFSGLDEEALDALGGAATLRHLKAGERLMRQGERGNEFYVILSGQLKLTNRADGDSDPYTLGVLGSGDYLGEMALLDDLPRSATAEAVAACELLVLDRDSFRRLVREHSDLSLGLLKGMARRLRQTSEDAAAIAHLDAYQRLVRKLVMRAEQDGATFKLDVETLGGMTGLEPAGVKLLVDLMAFDGLVRVKADQLTIVDLEGLRRSRSPGVR
jgi:CRP/FNR family transcriptional regulator